MNTIDELDEACVIFYETRNRYQPTDYMILIDEICWDCDIDKTAFISRLIYNLVPSS